MIEMLGWIGFFGAIISGILMIIAFARKWNRKTKIIILIVLCGLIVLFCCIEAVMTQRQMEAALSEMFDNGGVPIEDIIK